jgi:hypothetical protein
MPLVKQALRDHAARLALVGWEPDHQAWPQVEPVPVGRAAEPGGEDQQGHCSQQDGAGVDPAERAQAELADGMPPGL